MSSVFSSFYPDPNIRGVAADQNVKIIKNNGSYWYMLDPTLLLFLLILLFKSFGLWRWRCIVKMIKIKIYDDNYDKVVIRMVIGCFENDNDLSYEKHLGNVYTKHISNFQNNYIILRVKY